MVAGNHYAQWVNSLILKWMRDGQYLLTRDNYQEYIAEELEFYTTYDYSKLKVQIDYESDFYAAALLNEELQGVEPVDILESGSSSVELSNATIIDQQYQENKGIQCIGCLQRESGADISTEDYILQYDYVGAKIEIDDIGKHDYLVFYGKKVNDHGQPSVYVYDSQDHKIAEITARYQDLNNEWHQYVIDLTNVEGGITIFFNGGYIDNTGSTESNYIFSGITLY